MSYAEFGIHYAPAMDWAWTSSIDVGGHLFEYCMHGPLVSPSEVETVIGICIQNTPGHQLNLLGWRNTVLLGNRFTGEAKIAYDDPDDLDCDDSTAQWVPVDYVQTQQRPQTTLAV